MHGRCNLCLRKQIDRIRLTQKPITERDTNRCQQAVCFGAGRITDHVTTELHNNAVMIIVYQQQEIVTTLFVMLWGWAINKIPTCSLPPSPSMYAEPNISLHHLSFDRSLFIRLSTIMKPFAIVSCFVLLILLLDGN
jgi:hypothetical protein